MHSKVIVYILIRADGSYHFGATTDLAKRLTYHEEGKHEKTKEKLPVRLYFEVSFTTVQTALAFLAALKAASPAIIQEINTSNWVRTTINALSANVDVTLQVGEQFSEEPATVVQLPLTYMGNLQYYGHFLAVRTVELDVHSIFQKQSYRNRAVILAANGLQNLIVPVVRPSGKNTIMADVEISYAEDWQKNHIRAIESAYRKTPFYHFYAADLFEIIGKTHKRLVDLNLELTLFFTEKLRLSVTVKLATAPIELPHNLMNELLPKHRAKHEVSPYIQAFDAADGFATNLSVLDALFNQGPNAIGFLK